MHYLIIAVLAFGLSLMGCEGKTGPAGPSGSTGQAGPQGAAGPQGSTGPAGPAGPQGEKGDTGATGPAGPAGADGAQGPQGEKGETGETGPAGPAGADGAQGPQGEKGETGETGPAGPAGADGAPGEQGPKGDQGEQGPKGDQGEQGEPGEDGEDGAPGTIDPSAIAGAVEGVINSGVLAPIHHIVLIRDDTAKDKAPQWLAPAFMAPTFKGDSGFPIILLPGEETTIVAAAGSQDGEPIAGIDFDWVSDDDDVTVDDGMITANNVGNAEITVTAEGRGIVVKFDVSVQGKVDKVAVTPKGPFVVAIGDEIELSASATAKVDGASVGITVDFDWISSNEDVVTVSGAGVVTAQGAGSATVHATSGDKSSNKVRFTVSDPGVTIREMVLLDPTHDSEFVVAAYKATDNPVVIGAVEVGDMVPTADSAPATLEFMVEVYDRNNEGAFTEDATLGTWGTDGELGNTIRISTNNSAIIKGHQYGTGANANTLLADAMQPVKVATSGNVVTITVQGRMYSDEDSDAATPNIDSDAGIGGKYGRTSIVVSIQGADPIAIPITVSAPE